MRSRFIRRATTSADIPVRRERRPIRTGWKAATALRADGAQSGRYRVRLSARSPTTRSWTRRRDRRALHAHRSVLSPDVVRLNIVADRPDQLVAMTPEQLGRTSSALIAQATKLYGSQHYDHYDFLLTRSATRSRRRGARASPLVRGRRRRPATSPIGRTRTGAPQPAAARISPIAGTASIRRPADLWTPDYRTPMQDSLLWVYEGHDASIWGDVLSSRARGWSPSRDEALGELACDRRRVSGDRAGPRRGARSQDTTNEDDPLQPRAPMPWRELAAQRRLSIRRRPRSIWLDADQPDSDAEDHGHPKSLDDFAKLPSSGCAIATGGRCTYRFEDVVAALNQVHAL